MNGNSRPHQASKVGRRSTWLAAIATAFACAVAGQGARTDDLGAAPEYKVKGGYLFNFAKYIEWPMDPATTPGTPFVIAVLDAGEAAPVLKQLLVGKDIGGRPVSVRAVAGSPLPKDAQILFITRLAGHSPEEIRVALGSAPTLLVGETDEFAERGGAIAFVVEQNTVRLTICLEHAATQGLKVSARLSSVAKSVRAKRPI
jgi:hypothetical protein